MIRKIVQRIKLYSKLHLGLYLYLNYFCKSVIRTDKSRIIPYKNAVVDMDRTSRIYVGGGDIEIGCDRLKGSKAETLVRLHEGAVWSSEGGCKISYGATLEILQNAVLDSQYFTMNSNSVMIAAKKIRLGNDVMIGRNVVIYDSDHHAIHNPQGQITNSDKQVLLGDHVWLATNVMVLKGSEIGSGSMIAANAVVHGKVPANTLYRTETSASLREGFGHWERDHPEGDYDKI